MAKASAPNRNGTVNSFNQVDGYHEINIYNRTNVSQTYQYSYLLTCAEGNFSYSKYITLTPGATYTTNDHSYGTVQKSSQGSYRITAETKVIGESSASDRGTGTLTIKK